MGVERLDGYGEQFRRLTGHCPYRYQERVAGALLGGKHAVVNAPTGAGKTQAVLVPFLLFRELRGWTRLLYALPLRTLVQGVAAEAQRLLAGLGGKVTVQTGDNPEDPFFSHGDVVVTTYDQLLSGLLAAPYGLSSRLHNINAAAPVGTLVVFDEFHLMEGTRAFMTAVATMRLFRDLCQVTWMTATATSHARRLILDALPGSVEVNLDSEELFRLPAVAEVKRKVLWSDEPISPQAVLADPPASALIIFNTVNRAQTFFKALPSGVDAMLLHGAFFAADRSRKEEQLLKRFGPNGGAGGVLVATQVVEAGLNLSCLRLHTEVCPVNALIQRAGRCARFPGQKGEVWVHALPDDALPLPYTAEAIERTTAIVSGHSGKELNPEIAASWVEEAHGQEDAQALRAGWRQRLCECLDIIHRNSVLRQPVGVSELIRKGSDDVRIMIADPPPPTPGDREGVSISRSRLARLLREQPDRPPGWHWDAESQAWKVLTEPGELRLTYAVCLTPRVAAYDDKLGLRLGEAGMNTSPPRVSPPRPGHRPLQAESWQDHARAVMKQVAKRLTCELGPVAAEGWQRLNLQTQSLTAAALAAALLHDLGKLQAPWQRWAQEVQRRGGSRCESVLLAHTDFDPDDPKARDIERAVAREVGPRPPHAAPGAYYSCLYIPPYLKAHGVGLRPELVSAAAGAVLSHHGGWLPGEGELKVFPLVREAASAVEQVLNIKAVSTATIGAWVAERDRRGVLDGLLQLTASRQSLATWWPLVAYLTRVIRLADQGATREGSET